MKFEIFRLQSGEWMWRLKARNGRILADSAESYKGKAKVNDVVAKIQLGIGGAKVVEVEG